MTSKAVCDCLLNIVMTYSIPKVISSDCGSNFTSQLTREFLQRLGCSPVLKESWHGECAEQEQKRYADQYNMRSTDRKYLVGEKVLLFAPVASSGRKYYIQQMAGAGSITEVKSPYGGTWRQIERHLHANKNRKFHERIERAIVNNYSVIFEMDEDYGPISVVENCPPPPREDCLPIEQLDPTRVAHLSDVQKNIDCLQFWINTQQSFRKSPVFVRTSNMNIKSKSSIRISNWTKPMPITC